MVERSEIIWLGVASGVSGCLIGGMMLGIGMDLIVNGQPLGWLLLLPGAPVEQSAGEGEKLVARVEACGVPRVQVDDPARLADPVAPSAPMELHDEDVVARKHRLVRRGRRRLSRILHVHLHVQRGGGPCYGRKLRTLSVGSQGGTVEIPAANGV